MKRISMGLLVLATACSRHGTATLSSVELEASVPQQQTLPALAKSWENAMALRDLSLLSPVYAESVSFHGAPLRHDQVIQILSDAFTKDPSFTDKLLDVKTTSPTRVEVKRQWVRFGKRYTGWTWLEGKQEDGRWVVAAEGDKQSDERVASQKHGGPSAGFCDMLTKRIALATNEGRALVHGPPDHTDAFVATAPPEFPAYSVAITTTANGTPTTVGWIEVEPCFLYSPAPNVKLAPGVCVPPGGANGAVTDPFTGHVLTADPQLLTQMSKCPD